MVLGSDPDLTDLRDPNALVSSVLYPVFFNLCARQPSFLYASGASLCGEENMKLVLIRELLYHIRGGKTFY